MWVPDAVPAGWAPTARAGGSPDPYYGWTGRHRALGAGRRTTTVAGSSWTATGRGRRGRSSSGPCTSALVVFFGRPGVQVAGRQSVRQLGGAGMGRADRSVVGLAALHRSSPLGWLGRAARRQQRRHQLHDRGQSCTNINVPQRERPQRGGGGASGRVRSARGAMMRARARRRRAPDAAGSRPAEREAGHVELSSSPTAWGRSRRRTR